MYPIHSGLFTIQTSFKWLAKQYSLNQENKDLCYRLEILENYKNERDQLQKENQELRNFLTVIPSNPGHKVITRIISIPHFRLGASMVVSMHPNIAVDDCVMHSQGIVGRIKQIGVLTAEVLLITDSKSSIPAYVKRTCKHVMLVGNNTNNLTVISATKGHLLVGDILISSGVGGVFPPKIPIARIKGFSKNGSPIATPIVDPFSLEYVMVVHQEASLNGSNIL